MDDQCLKALRLIVSDMNDLGIDFGDQIALQTDTQDKLSELCDQYGYQEGIVQYYIWLVNESGGEH